MCDRFPLYCAVFGIALTIRPVEPFKYHTSTMILINENDVLLGRGGRNHEHEGNEQLRRIAHSRVREYERASKKQKAVISRGENG